MLRLFDILMYCQQILDQKDYQRCGYIEESRTSHGWRQFQTKKKIAISGTRNGGEKYRLLQLIMLGKIHARRNVDRRKICCLRNVRELFKCILNQLFGATSSKLRIAMMIANPFSGDGKKKKKKKKKKEKRSKRRKYVWRPKSSSPAINRCPKKPVRSIRYHLLSKTKYKLFTWFLGDFLNWEFYLRSDVH